MKKFLSVPILIFLFCCKKQNTPLQNVPAVDMTNVKIYLKNQMLDSDYRNLDFRDPSIVKQHDHYLFRFGFLNKPQDKDFLLLESDLNQIDSGLILHLEKKDNSAGLFNGNISLRKLNRSLIFESSVTNGFVQALHPRMYAPAESNALAPDIIPDPSESLPEVIVVGYLPSSGSGNLIFNDYLSFESLLNTGGGTSSGFYNPLGSLGASPSLPPPANLRINFENSFSAPGIGIEAYLECFSEIPDAGANCSATIYTDLPVNDDPTKFFNWYTGATGHVFLQLVKSNATQSISQIFGFTAQKPLAAITGSNPVASKIVDNSGHKYNGLLRMSISPAELQTMISEIEFLAPRMAYSITNYNCVDFALQVFNTVRGLNPLVIPKFPIPGQSFSSSNTPEGLYRLLENMEAAGTAEAGNILTGVIQYAGKSHGPCQ